MSASTSTFKQIVAKSERERERRGSGRGFGLDYKEEGCFLLNILYFTLDPFPFSIGTDI
jgi:hypothetical protein